MKKFSSPCRSFEFGQGGRALPGKGEQRALGSFTAGLKDIFAVMDQDYRALADVYGFSCEGCPDNCCQSRFYHHTFLEYFYLQEGFEALPDAERLAIKQRAEQVRQGTAAATPGEGPVRFMCPLNFDQRCKLYRHRPMICRLHGIPHALRQPGGAKISGPGCSTFSSRCLPKESLRLDRTPFYVEMARLEKEFKAAFAIEQRLKMTVAEMIGAFGAP